jgi:formylglycine-generating enzyme required for sulfatase activity
MAEELGAGGLYQIMPPGDIKRALLDESQETYKECYDEQCQIKLGRQLAASKLLTTTIKKLGGKCRVTASLYDLRKQTTDTTASHKCKCKEAGYVTGIEVVASKLREWAGGDATDVELPKEGSDTKASAGADDKEYKRALNKAWRKLAKDVRRGTTESKLEKYQEFLADYPDNNPHAAKVQKNIDALDAKLEKQEAAKLKAEEKKAALAAKRQRSKDLKAAYNAAKASKGSASEQLSAWERFIADYPDKNPYLKTARRKIKGLKLLAKKEAKQAPAGMARIPAGEFWMGCNPKVDQECQKDEKPGRRVYLDEYLMDRTEVTVGKYGECVTTGRCKAAHFDKCAVYDGKMFRRGKLPEKFRGASLPVVCVDWAEAKSYCEWANKRLPSEAEWEKASRGTDGLMYPWGNEQPSCHRAVMKDGGLGCGKDRTWPVCSKKKGNSPYGLCDMAGNVMEWVSDWYGEEYYGEGPSRNPKGQPDGTYRVLRGGNWYRAPGLLRASRRFRGHPTNHYDSTGFRCARSSPM